MFGRPVRVGRGYCDVCAAIVSRSQVEIELDRDSGRVKIRPIKGAKNLSRIRRGAEVRVVSGEFELCDGDILYLANLKFPFRVKIEEYTQSPTSTPKKQGTLTSFFGSATKKRKFSEISAKISSAAGASSAAGDSSASSAGGSVAKKLKRNDALVEVFTRMESCYKALGDVNRMRTYSKAVKTIEQHPVAITSGQQAMKCEGIGKGIAKKVDQILATGTCEKLKELEADKVVKAHLELTQVHGVGPKFVKKLREEHGIHTIEQLAEQQHLLDSQQKIGLKYWSDFQERIPRAEVAQLENHVQKVARAHDEKLLVMVCGSYRRGKASSGDIDLLITHPQFDVSVEAARSSKASTNKHLAGLVHALHADGFLCGDLAHGSTKYMGVCKLTPQSKARRVDIRLLPCRCFCYGTLYFTGSDDTNVEMREAAIKIGWLLNEYELKHSKSGERFIAKTERDIFVKLRLAYKEPHQR